MGNRNLHFREFTLREAAQMLGLDTSKRRMVCPECGHKSASFDWEHGVFNCPACGNYGGGILDLWIYHRGLSNLPLAQARKEASRQMNLCWLGLDYETTSRMEKESAEIKKREKQQAEIAPIEQRDRTYRGLLNLCTLKEEHLQDLFRRGLTMEDICRLGIKSFPDDPSIGARLSYAGFRLNGVPGFYRRPHYSWQLIKPINGYLIPQMNLYGFVQGMQIRCFGGNAKYISLSSAGYELGTKSRAFIHVAMHDYGTKETPEVILTEGPLKADIINTFTGKPVIAVPGVSSLGLLPETLLELKKRGLKQVHVAYDMDLYTNEMVLKNLQKLKAGLSRMDIQYCTMKWDRKLKGLDDYLLARNSSEGIIVNNPT